MSSPFATYPVPERTFLPANSTTGAADTPTKGAGIKRGRKPKNTTFINDFTPHTSESPTASLSSQVRWAPVRSGAPGPKTRISPTQGPSADQDPHTQNNLDTPGGTNPSGDIGTPSTPSGEGPNAAPAAAGPDNDGEGEDELLPAMADDDYSAQLSWQSQSKDNLKCVYICLLCIGLHELTVFLAIRVLMDNFGPAQYEKFEAYRRHALPKQAIRKV